MTMNHDDEEDRPEGTPQDLLGDSDVEKGSNETPETEPQMTLEDKQNNLSVTFTVASAEQPLGPAVPREHHACVQRRRGQIEHMHYPSDEISESRRTSYKTKTGHTHGSKRLSSLELRRLPVDVLLKPILNDNASVLSDEFHLEDKERKEVVGEKKDLLHVLCLRPGYSLRTQLMLSFGTISFITIFAVVVTCIIVAVFTGQYVKSTSQEAFETVANGTPGLTARYVAESLSEKLLLVDVVKMIHEATQDRFAGYPSASEDAVPFFDVLSGEPRYPIDFPPPPLEWQFETNVNNENYEEHFQGQNYYRSRPASTASASFLMKGICDPAETDPMGDAYWPNCTDANNDISTGGVWEPTDTAELIYIKSKDLVPLLKALYESRDVIRDMGLYFSNSGAGASLNYPHYPISTQSTYESFGCEWMATPNYFDPTKPIGTQEMIDRCSPNKKVVSSRIYSPVERLWCAEQALEPDRVHYFAGSDAWDNGFWLLTMGRSVYDRITNEFIACIYVGIGLGVVDQELRRAKVVDDETLTLVDWDEAGLVIGSSTEGRNTTEQISIYDMDVGVSKDTYERLYELVDFDAEWDPEEVEKKYSSYLIKQGDYFVTAYPMPPVPKMYDKTYHPLFLVVVSTPIKAVLGIVNEASDIVDERVRDVNLFCIAAGAVGLVIALLVIVMMADMLTKPLGSMNKVANDIVSNFGDPTKENAIENSEDGIVSKESRCTPKTELSEVVREFNKMVASFSGSQMVKTGRHKLHEVFNMFNLQEDFAELYEGRGKPAFKYSVEPPVSRNEDSQEEQSMAYFHGGTNILEDHDTFTTNPPKYQKGQNGNNFSSPLFLWIVALIVTPLLAVNIIITAVALNSVSKEFTDGLDQAETFFLSVEKRKLEVHARLRADFVAGLTKRATSDLHVLSRYAGWLLFGGLLPSDSYTELVTGVEECKSYSDVFQCPFVQENDVCDCEWQDQILDVQCQTYPSGSRTLQKTYWACQSDDADENGDRHGNSYPATSYSPESTAWWDDQQFVPGWNNASIADAGYDTLYNRLRTASAIPLFETIYNYHNVKESTIASYLSFEADGLFVGYRGCDNALHVELKNFQSTVDNGAARLRPELCPLGKFGYDPRCRGWYDTGRRLAINNATYLHITAPYEFATHVQGGVTFAQSATTPLMDPATGEHVGQVLFDFLPTTMIRSLKDDTPLSAGGFPILVATESAYNADTVIGPNYELSDPPTAIAAKVLPFDIDCDSEICQSNIASFNDVVSAMKGGNETVATFYRTTDKGLEKVFMAYAPVAVRSFRPIDSSDFSRGLSASEYLIYSLALAETESGILETFRPIQEVTDKQIKIAIGVLTALLVFATVLVVYVSMRVTQSIAEPMVYLLEIIRSIRKAGKDEPPDLRTVKASQEIVKFSDSIEMLSKVVRSANTAFYAGEFEAAYYVLVDALRLFRRLDNKKAIGIACNNLGNTMMGMYQEMTKDNLQKLAGLTRRQLVVKGIAYYHEAIELGEKAYDEFYELHGWTPICLDFMQHLSNRYFNRALFLLTVKDTHERPDEMEDLGKRDLQIAHDMDAEVVAYGEDIGWEANDRIEKLFNVKIVRSCGYNLLLGLGYEDEWDVKDILDEAFDIINVERKHPNSALFSRVTFAGRMQEVETEIMKYFQATGDIKTAATVAIRCLFEDEKVFVDAQSRAIEVLLEYADTIDGWTDSTKSRIKNTLQDYTEMLEDAVNHQNQTSINDLESDVITKATGGSASKGRRFSSKSWSLHQSSGRFVTMEDF